MLSYWIVDALILDGRVQNLEEDRTLGEEIIQTTYHCLGVSEMHMMTYEDT